MSSDDFLSQSLNNPKAKGALDELLKTEEGRELAAKIRIRLKELNEQFKGLTGDDKKEFIDNFREKFSDSLGDLKDSLREKISGSPDGQFKIKDDNSQIPPPVHYGPQQNYMLFIGAIVIVLILFG